MGGRFCLLVLIGLCLVAFTSGSQIKFNASQPSIQPPLTDDLSLRCGLADTNAAPTASAVIGKRDVTKTADDVAYVTPVAVKKDGVDIALINEHFPAKSLVNSANLQVSGSVAATAGEKGYLELSWHRPDLHQVGEYKCEVTALMTSGSSVVYTATLEVARDELGLDDIVNHISTLQIREEANRKIITDLRNSEETNRNVIADLQNNERTNRKVITDLQSNEQANKKVIADLQNKEASLEAKVQDHQKTIVSQSTAINNLRNNTSTQISTILKTITERTHMESGMVKFGPSSTWTPQDGNAWVLRQTITFKRPFPSPPQIITSLERYYSASDKSIFFRTAVINVTKTGFTLETWTDHDYLNQIHYMYTYWMAVPPFK